MNWLPLKCLAHSPDTMSAYIWSGLRGQGVVGGLTGVWSLIALRLSSLTHTQVIIRGSSSMAYQRLNVSE